MTAVRFVRICDGGRHLQIEAGLDRGSTSVQGIREMTALVLSPSAQGLEPRIVRGIIERLQQQVSLAAQHASLVPSNIALLLLLSCGASVCAELFSAHALSAPRLDIFFAGLPFHARVSANNLIYMICCRTLPQLTQSSRQLPARRKWPCCMCWTVCSR